LSGLLAGTGMGAGLGWLALRHHRGLTAETEMATHAQAANQRDPAFINTDPHA
jgi:hypothetical protein